MLEATVKTLDKTLDYIKPVMPLPRRPSETHGQRDRQNHRRHRPMEYISFAYTGRQRDNGLIMCTT